MRGIDESAFTGQGFGRRRNWPRRSCSFLSPPPVSALLKTRTSRPFTGKRVNPPFMP